MSAALALVEKTPESWCKYVEGSQYWVPKLINDGMPILQYQRKAIIPNAVKSHWTQVVTMPYDAPFNGKVFLVPCCMATECASEIGNELLVASPMSPFSMTYRDMLTEKGVKRSYSLRSGAKGTASESFDCSEVAKAFGGGGHAKACGFVRYPKVSEIVLES
jgi:hypothetical protein